MIDLINMNINNKKKYEALSLLEMLITLLIIGVVLLVVSITLTALIKSSAISAARTLVRDDTEYIFEIAERYIQNTQVDEIYLYKVVDGYGGSWGVSPDGTIVVPQGPNDWEFYDPVNDPPDYDFDALQIHLRPIGTSQWVCIGFYPGMAGTDYEELGFIVKAPLAPAAPNDFNCIQNAVQRSYLNGDEVDVNQFTINVYPGSGENFNFLIDMEVEPVHWVPGRESKFKPEYYRQLIVSTKKLTY